jgi:hypothetical protein
MHGGKTVEAVIKAVSGVPMTRVGIAPPDFQGVWPGAQAKMYLPLHFLPIASNIPDLLEEKNTHLFTVDVIGRLEQRDICFAERLTLSEGFSHVALVVVQRHRYTPGRESMLRQLQIAWRKTR